MFCDHYKMAGHAIQKWHKLHGYPPDHRLYRGRRLAAVGQTDNIGQPLDSLYSSLSMEGTQATIAPPSLTHE